MRHPTWERKRGGRRHASPHLGKKKGGTTASVAPVLSRSKEAGLRLRLRAVSPEGGVYKSAVTAALLAIPECRERRAHERGRREAFRPEANAKGPRPKAKGPRGQAPRAKEPMPRGLGQRLEAKGQRPRGQAPRAKEPVARVKG